MQCGGGAIDGIRQAAAAAAMTSAVSRIPGGPATCSLLRKRLAAGDTDKQALDYIVARYGVFVLLDPPFEPTTYMLWLGPPLLVLAIGASLVVRARRRSDRDQPPLTEEERARAAALLSEHG